MLSDGTHTYLYGHERLATAGPAGTTWELYDALGSVRLLLDDAGAPVAPQAYSPFGVPTNGAPEPFGFTGELHSQDTGLVYLRARWYDPSAGVFTARDPFAGFERMPYSLHPYQYAYSSPSMWTDSSGEQACNTVDSEGRAVICPNPEPGRESPPMPPIPTPGTVSYWRFNKTLTLHVR